VAERDQQSTSTAGPQAKIAPAAAPAPKGVRALNHQMRTQHGHPSVATVVQLMGSYPDDRDAMMDLLHRQLGNGFVQQVVDALKRAHAVKAAPKTEPEPEHAVVAEHPAAAAPAATPKPEPVHEPAAPAPEADNRSWWRKAGETTVGVAGITGEFALLVAEMAMFDPIHGTCSGSLDLARALHFAELINPGIGKMITLGAAPKGSNKVYAIFNLYHHTVELTAPNLEVAKFSHSGLVAGSCDLQGLVAHGSSAGFDVTFTRAVCHDVTFLREGQKLGATEMEIAGLRATDSGGVETMSFAGANIHGLQYPNMPPIDFDVPGGASFDAVWAHTAGPVAKTTTPGGPLPTTPDVLPHGSRIAIKLVGLGGKVAGDTGNAGFEMLHAAIVQDGHELASIEIDGFHAAGAVGPGGAATAGASIRQLSISGDPKLVQTLLKSPQIADQPNVKSALDLVKSTGLDPSTMGGHIVAHNITANHSATGDQAKGDFDGTFEVPQLGTIQIALAGMTANASAGTVATQFDRLTMTLKDPHSGAEIAYLELGGVAAKLSGPKTHGQVHQLAARGNIAKLVTAGDSIVRHAPLDVRGALQAVRALGVSGEITGTLSVDSDGKSTSFGGDFDAQLDAGTAGSVGLHVTALHGTDAGALSFDMFSATMKDSHGKVAASLTVSGGSSTEAKKGNEGQVHAKQIQAHGEDATVTAMIAAIQAKATTLPDPVKASFGLVRRFYANAGGSLSLSNASVGQDKAGHDVARASEANATFALHGVGTAQVALTGFHSVLGARSDEVSFASFDATLLDTAGHKVARMRVEGSQDTFANQPSAKNKNPDFQLSAKSVHIEGDSRQAGALLTGIHQHISTLPQPIAASFKLIEQYTSEVSASGTIDASDVALASKSGTLSGHGNLEAHVRVAEGMLDAKLTNSRSDGEHLGFDALDLSVKDASGAVAASLHATGARADIHSRTTTLGDIQIHGTAEKLRGVLDPALQRRLPAAIGQALAMLDDSSLNLSANGVAVTQGPGGDTRAEARTIMASGTIHLNDAAGNSYTCQGAKLELDGAEVVLGSDGKPKELAATSMSIQGNFTSAGGGTALRGNATLRTGAARIELDAAGAPVGVHVSQIYASGAGDRRTTTTTPAATTTPTKGQRLASLDSETATAESIAPMIQTADVRATLPLFAGKYGSGLKTVGVPAGAAINITLEVRDNALTNETSVHIAPPLDLPAWITAQGVDLETKGREGVLNLQVGGFFGHFVPKSINKYVVGKGPLSLDLPSLIAEVTGNIRKGIETAQAPDPAAAARDAAKDDQKLASQHASWQKTRDRDVSRGANQKTLDKDAGNEPRSENAADIATKGVDLTRSSASADVVLGGGAGAVSGHLHGAANGGGRLQISADALNATVDGQHVAARGVDTGPVQVASEGNDTSVQLQNLSIADLTWHR
jgi:hypothetical protein